MLGCSVSKTFIKRGFVIHAFFTNFGLINNLISSETVDFSYRIMFFNKDVNLSTRLNKTGGQLRTLIAILTLCALLTTLHEDVFARQFQGSIDFNIGAPQGEFNDQLDRLGYGLNFTAGYQFRESPFMLGIDFGFMNFGTDSREEPLSSTIPDLTVLVENSYNLVTGNILVRAMTPEATVRPFIEGMVGFNYFYTETTIRERGFSSDEPVLRDTNFDDIALNYGIGGGVQFLLWRNRIPDVEITSTDVHSVYLNVAGRYLPGREAEYLQEGSIIRDNGQVTYDVSRSKTDLLYFKLGVGVRF